MHAPTWTSLPAEMKYAVVGHLSVEDTASFSKTCREAYALSIPTLYREVKLHSYTSMQAFLHTVPPTHCHHVRTLTVDTTGAHSALAATTDLSNVLAQCSEIQDLDLRVAGSLRPTIIPHFRALRNLTRLSIRSCSVPNDPLLSERLVVSIAASIPNLVHLTLDGVCRSAIHARELVGAYPYAPVVIGDEDVPEHPKLGDQLSLPSLMLIPTLRELRIRNTHLGDRRWSVVTPLCKLDTLEVGSCSYESPAFNRACAERIVDAAGRSVQDLSLSAALSSDACARLALSHLTKLRVTSLLPLEDLAQTLTALSDSPVETLELECHEDDVEDQCVELSDFLASCQTTTIGSGDRRPIFPRLRRVSLESVEDISDPTPVKSTIFECSVEDASRTSAVDRWRECLDEFTPARCEEVESPTELRDFASYLPPICRPVEPVMEQLMWTDMMEAW